MLNQIYRALSDFLSVQKMFWFCSYALVRQGLQE